MKGQTFLILAAGNGTRLGPITAGGYPKPLVGVFDKPCFFYGLAAGIAAGYTKIGVIIKPGTRDLFTTHFGDGTSLGVHLEYIEQPEQIGTANAFVVASDFIEEDNVTLYLGDNIFIGDSFTQAMIEASNTQEGCTAFLYQVPLHEASKYGVAEYRNGQIISIEEKPSVPKSSLIIPGVYFCDNGVVEVARALKPSPRGEYEISDVLLHYLSQGTLKGVRLSRDVDWHDTGNVDSQQNAAVSVQRWQAERGAIVGSPEVEALKRGLIDTATFAARIEEPGIVKSAYANYLRDELAAYIAG